MSGDMTSIRDRLQSLEQQKTSTGVTSNGNNKLGDITMPPLKDRLSCLHSAASKEDIKKKPVQLVDDRQLEIMKTEEEYAQQRLRAQQVSKNLIADIETELGNTFQQLKTATTTAAANEGEAQLNAAIAALEVEEKKLDAAANAVNEMEAEFAELSNNAILNSTSVTTTTTTATTNDMEFSVSDTNENLVKNSIEIDTSGVVSSSHDEISNINSGSKNELLSDNTKCKLQRKPTNEMIHHRILLKMFRDTFNTDSTENVIIEKEQLEIAVDSPITASTTIQSYTPYTAVNINPEDMRTVENSQKIATSMIPRSVVHTAQVGKPPMSPKLSGSHKFSPSPSPLCSPTPTTKAENQFSINGRVEIFNSKTLNNNENDSLSKKNTPTLSRKSFLPHLISNNTHTATAAAPAADGVVYEEFALPITTSTMVTVKSNEPLTMVSNHSSLETEAHVDVDRKLMSPATVSEPQVIRSITSTTNERIIIKQEALKDQQKQHKNQDENEIVICAPPVTILNPDELPKPNTVKSLASCFSIADDVVDGCKMTPPSTVLLPPRPMPRTNMTKLPRQMQNSSHSFIPTHTTEFSKLPKRNLGNNNNSNNNNSIIKNDTEANEIQSYGTVILHKTIDNKPLVSTCTQAGNPLKPNDSLATVISEPAIEPQLVSCTPNSSSLFKLAGSVPSSPISTRSNDSSKFKYTGSIPPSPVSPRSNQAYQPADADIALCADLLDSLGATAHIEKIVAHPKLQHQNTVEEVIFKKVDVKKLPPGNIEPCTGFAEVTVEDIERCDGVQIKNQTELASAVVNVSVEDKALSEGITNKKINTPTIDKARTSHSKELRETCERIIAEERLASSRLKSAIAAEAQTSMANSQKPTTHTPLMQRKSKIPLPKSLSCLKGSESMNSADLDWNYQEQGPLIARLHVVETQIKVTTTSPPTSPSVMKKTQKSQIPSPTTTKKTNNIFDFLKKNFGHHEQSQKQEANISGAGSNEVKKKEILSENEIHTVDNSTFYLPAEVEVEAEVPPPLPATPAPVNIEITKTITTNEILEAANTELGLSQEINELLDDELNMLTLEKGASVSGAK